MVSFIPVATEIGSKVDWLLMKPQLMASAFLGMQRQTILIRNSGTKIAGS